jgi:DNA invertase Pin-like site-specific DNA recombinase
MTKAYAYLRVSGPSQLLGDGYPRQQEACEKYAAANDLEIVEIFREKAVSGTKELTERPALAELLIALQENGVTTMIIEKLDRLARDLMVQESIIADLIKRGYTLISTHEPDLLSDDPGRKLMRQIMGAIHEYDRAMLVQKLRAARDRERARKGRCEGTLPYGGYPQEAETFKTIMTMWELGYSYTQIAKHLNDDNILTRLGRRWFSQSISKIVRRTKAQT